MKLKIRKATVKDLDIVAELFLKQLRELKKFEPSLKVGTKKDAKKAVRGSGKRTRYFVILVAEANGEIVGFVNNIYVLPEYRRKGIATKLLTSIIKKFKMRNLTMCTLDAYVKNKKAISLWKKNGI